MARLCFYMPSSLVLQRVLRPSAFPFTLNAPPLFTWPRRPPCLCLFQTKDLSRSWCELKYPGHVRWGLGLRTQSPSLDSVYRLFSSRFLLWSIIVTPAPSSLSRTPRHDWPFRPQEPIPPSFWSAPHSTRRRSSTLRRSSTAVNQNGLPRFCEHVRSSLLFQQYDGSPVLLQRGYSDGVWKLLGSQCD